MPDVLTSLQLGLSALLLGVIVDRAYCLLYAAPLSKQGLDFVSRALGKAELDALRIFAEHTSGSHVGRILRVAFQPAASGEQESRDDALAELSFELSAEATVRLRALRVGATIASTTGLVVGIVRLRGGFGKAPGLLALQAGLSERLSLADALFSMAIGVGTSAVCFYALSVFREAARALIAQRTRVENALLAQLRAAATSAP